MTGIFLSCNVKRTCADLVAIYLWRHTGVQQNYRGMRHLMSKDLLVADPQELLYVYANPQGDASRLIVTKQLCDSLRIF